MVGRRHDKGRRFGFLAVNGRPAFAGLVKGEMSGELVADRHGPPQIERKAGLGSAVEIERDMPALDDPAGRVGPFGIENAVPRRRVGKAVDGGDRGAAFDFLRQRQLVGHGNATGKAEAQHHRRRHQAAGAAHAARHRPAVARQRRH